MAGLMSGVRRYGAAHGGLVPGVVGISIMFQGVQSIALNMAQEFGFTREIEDRVQAPCPIWLVAMAKVLSGAAQGILSAAIVLPMASVVPVGMTAISRAAPSRSG